MHSVEQCQSRYPLQTYLPNQRELRPKVLERLELLDLVLALVQGIETVELMIN
jgi:hypothetical protein